MKILPYKKNPGNKFAVVRVHYSADPSKDEEWKAKAMEGMPEKGWLREYEIDYSSYAGKIYFPEFSELNIAKENITYKPPETLYRGWDYGWHRPCCVITRQNVFDQWCLIKVILGQDEGILAFGRRVDEFCRTTYPGATYIDADDIAGTQVSDKSEKTSRQILNTLGIYPRARKQEIRQGAEIIRQKLGMRTDGKVGLLVNPDQTDLIDGFKGGLHYPEIKEGQPEKEFYQKDGYYDHCFSLFTSICTEAGIKQIHQIESLTDSVLTRKGFKFVLEKFNNGIQEVKLYVMSNGSYLIATPNHKVWVIGEGFKEIDKVGYNDRIGSCETLTGQNANLNKLLSMGCGLIATLTQKLIHYESIIYVPRSMRTGVEYVSMSTFGKKLIVLSLRATVFITEMVILLIINFQIWLWLGKVNTLKITGLIGRKIRDTWKECSKILSKPKKLLRNGTKHQKEESGIVSAVKESGKTNLFTTRLVKFVEKHIKPIFLKKPNTAQTIVNQGQPGYVQLIKKSKSFRSPTFNLAVNEIHEYYANGILVSNCFDSLRYIAVEMFTLVGLQQQPNSITQPSTAVSGLTQEGRSMGSPNVIMDDYSNELSDFFG